MSYVKNLNPILFSHPQILTIGEHTTFGQTLKKIKNSKQLEFIWVPKPRQNQMAAVLLSRLFGKKFFWIQGFENPPLPKFTSGILLNQADRVIVNSKDYRSKLIKLGIKAFKIRFQK